MNMDNCKITGLNQDNIDFPAFRGNEATLVAAVKLNGELEERIQELKIAEDGFEHFVYSIIHDLKSPAVGVYGLTERLYRVYGPVLDDTGKAYCSQIMQAADGILKLVEKINTYIIAKEAPLQFEMIPLKEITATIRGEFFCTLSTRPVRWKEPESLPTIIGDKVCIIRVLRNLVDNALKYGGARLSEITIQYRDEAAFHTLLVSNNGIPLDKESADQLFQRFHRGTGSRAGEGAGLGLAIVKEIVERHGGKVWLDFEKEDVTTFAITISKALREQQGPKSSIS